MTKYALLSCSNKANLVPFAKGLCANGYTLLSTGGTALALKSEGIEFVKVSDFTLQDEILGGRVKTLHPKIHAGILANRASSSDMATMSDLGFPEIEIVAVNLYPFEKKVSQSQSVLSDEELVEFIDVGGPTMLRAAAKNFSSVYSIVDPDDYQKVLDAIESKADALVLRKNLAAKVFATTSVYDLLIAEELSKAESGGGGELSEYTGMVVQRKQRLRYGENPHQQASWTESVVSDHSKQANLLIQLQGKELSYNNLNDLDAALRLTLDLAETFPTTSSCVILKHANPCGVAIGEEQGLFTRALSCDPISAFGGIISCNFEVSETLAHEIVGSFYEILIAPSFDYEALQILSGKKNLRVLSVDIGEALRLSRHELVFKNLLGSQIVQTSDNLMSDVLRFSWAVGSAFEGTEEMDARLAWATCKHVKSNAIVIAKNGLVIGVGAGQMNRVDAVRFAIDRAQRNGHDVSGSAVGSDAFFPFADNVELLHEAGVRLIVQPGGSVRDDEVVAVAKQHEIKMILSGVRHFKH